MAGRRSAVQASLHAANTGCVLTAEFILGSRNGSQPALQPIGQPYRDLRPWPPAHSRQHELSGAFRLDPRDVRL